MMRERKPLLRANHNRHLNSIISAFKPFSLPRLTVILMLWFWWMLKKTPAPQIPCWDASSKNPWIMPSSSLGKVIRRVFIFLIAIGWAFHWNKTLHVVDSTEGRESSKMPKFLVLQIPVIMNRGRRLWFPLLLNHRCRQSNKSNPHRKSGTWNQSWKSIQTALTYLQWIKRWWSSSSAARHRMHIPGPEKPLLWIFGQVKILFWRQSHKKHLFLGGRFQRHILLCHQLVIGGFNPKEATVL